MAGQPARRTQDVPDIGLGESAPGPDDGPSLALRRSSFEEAVCRTWKHRDYRDTVHLEFTRLNHQYRSLHPQRLKNSIRRIGVETRLELGEELTRYCRNIPDAGHRKEQTFRPCIRRNLQ